MKHFHMVIPDQLNLKLKNEQHVRKYVKFIFMKIIIILQNFYTYNVSIYQIDDQVESLEERDLIKKFKFSTQLFSRKSNLLIKYNSIFMFKKITQKLKVEGLNNTLTFKFMKDGWFKPRIYKSEDYSIIKTPIAKRCVPDHTIYKGRNVILIAEITERNKVIGGIIEDLGKEYGSREIFITESTFENYYFIVAYFYFHQLGISARKFY